MENKKERKPYRIYERVKEEDFLKMIEVCKKKKQQKYIIILLLAYGGGLRLQEILNLEPDNIEVKERKIKVRQGKGSRDRITLLPKQFKEEYKKYLPLDMSKMAIQKFFLKLTLSLGINKIIDTYKLKTGKERNIYRYHFHCLRHSFAHNCLANGTPISVVQEFLGHKNISTTSRYTKITGDDAIAIALSKGL